MNDRLFTWFETNRKNLVIGAVVAILATFVIFFYLDLQHKKQVAAGFKPIMPTFQGQLSEEELFQLIAYIKTLK